jgi:hypothetical protein
MSAHRKNFYKKHLEPAVSENYVDTDFFCNTQDAINLSIAISLKRIADTLEGVGSVDSPIAKIGYVCDNMLCAEK